MQSTERVWFWAKIAVGVLVILAILQLVRVNEELKPSPPAVAKYTEGSIVRGTIKVPAGSFLSYRINLNRAVVLSGSFDTMSEKLRIECLVLDEANFEKWRAWGHYEAVSETGHIPTATVSPRIGPGVYHLVLSGRKNTEKAVSIEAGFTLD